MSQIGLRGIDPRNFGRRARLSNRWMAVFLIFILTLGFCSCDSPKRTLLGESRSPDGKVIAKVYRDEPSGIGTGEIDTFVALDWTKGSQSPTIVLAFDDGLDTSEGDKNV